VSGRHGNGKVLVNLEDFKSFRRVLKPSEVGSIPTHSRQLARSAAGVVAAGPERTAAALSAVAAAVLVLALTFSPAAPAAADEGAAEIRPSATNRAVRSMVFPAWGQVTNGRPVKAAVLFSVQTWILTRVIKESRAAHESEQRVFRLQEQGATALEISLAEASAEEHSARRRDMMFWALFSGLYGALDAYIDAHLGDFDEEIQEGRDLFADVDPVNGEVALGVRF